MRMQVRALGLPGGLQPQFPPSPGNFLMLWEQKHKHKKKKKKKPQKKENYKKWLIFLSPYFKSYYLQQVSESKIEECFVLAWEQEK